MRCSRAEWAASSEWRSHAGAGDAIHDGCVHVGDVRVTSEGSGSSTPGGESVASDSGACAVQG